MIRFLAFIMGFMCLLGGNLLAKERKVVFLGDSLTAGYQLSVEEAFPALIGKKLEKTEWISVNAGISGDTSAGGLARTKWILKGQPDVVFLALGANDGLRGIPVYATQRNLAKIIELLQGSGATVIVAGMMLPVNYGGTYRKQFSDMYKNLSLRYHTGYMPFLLEGVALNPDLNLADGIHPNAKGHRVLAESIFKVIEPVLKKREHGEQ
jgi:acyl-CoA thioesterase-1